VRSNEARTSDVPFSNSSVNAPRAAPSSSTGPRTPESSVRSSPEPARMKSVSPARSSRSVSVSPVSSVIASESPCTKRSRGSVGSGPNAAPVRTRPRMRCATTRPVIWVDDCSTLAW